MARESVCETHFRFSFLPCLYIYIYMIDLEDLRLQNSSFHGLTFASKMKTMLDRELPF